MTDDALIQRLYTEGDRLPRDAAEAIVARGEAVAPRLAEIIANPEAWHAEGGAAWAPVHAMFLLGAIGGRAAVGPLIQGVRRAVEEEEEWILNEAGALLAHLGEAGEPALRALALDRKEHPYIRVIGFDALGLLAARRADRRGETLDLFRRIASDAGEASSLRGMAGYELMQFAAPEDRPLLQRLAAEGEEGGEIAPMVNPEDVDACYRRGPKTEVEPETGWMSFYGPDRIAERQRRWAREAEADWWAGEGADLARQEEAIADLVKRFEASPACADLDARWKSDAAYLAEEMMQFLVFEEDGAPWHWDREVLRSFLRDYFPARVHEEYDDSDAFARRTPDLAARVFRFWAAEGKLTAAEAEDLSAAAKEAGDAFVALVKDPPRDALDEELEDEMRMAGVDPDDDEAVARWFAEREEEAEDGETPPPPIVNETPGPGRNDPCPCGSGKKYKKCCGKGF
jgi:hypothetical protein